RDVRDVRSQGRGERVDLGLRPDVRRDPLRERGRPDESLAVRGGGGSHVPPADRDRVPEAHPSPELEDEALLLDHQLEGVPQDLDVVAHRVTPRSRTAAPWRMRVTTPA